MPETRSPAAPPESFNFAAWLLQASAARAGKTAYIDDTQRLTYGELAERVRRCAAGLLALGMTPGERVLLVLHDTVDFPVAFLGALYAGVVPVPVNTLLPQDDYRYMLAHSEARMLLVSQSLLPALQAALDGMDAAARPQVVVSGGDAPAGAHGFASLLSHEALAQPAATRAADIGFWLYSSGSTGKPKGTVHTHANLYWTTELYAKPVLQLREDDTVFSAAKLFFAYGLGNALTFALSVGATVVLMAERPTPAAVFKRLVEHKPTVFYGVPTLYVAMLASDALPAREQVALRLCISAGEALPREVGERFQAHFGCEILDGIGSTEMLHIFLSNRPAQVRYGTTGKPVEGYTLELRGEDGRPVASGELGDLYIRGPSAALMYWNDPDKSAATFRDGWVKSGDKYTMDADGFYTYGGRSDDMLKVSGQYVSPIEVELALMGHAAVLECAVVGVPDAQGLTRTRACVVLNSGMAASDELAADLQVFVKSRLTPHKYPREIVFVADLPKTATGKIQRFKLREQGLG